MYVKSVRLGDLNVDPDTVLTFPHGLPGFESSTRYSLFHAEGQQPMVYWMQSLDEPEVTFSVADPATFGIYYDFELDQDDAMELGDSEPEDLQILILLFREEGAEGQIKGSVKSPLVINTKTQTGLQKHLQNLEPQVVLTDKAKSIEFKA